MHEKTHQKTNSVVKESDTMNILIAILIYINQRELVKISGVSCSLIQWILKQQFLFYSNSRVVELDYIASHSISSVNAMENEFWLNFFSTKPHL